MAASAGRSAVSALSPGAASSTQKAPTAHRWPAATRWASHVVTPAAACDSSDGENGSRTEHCAVYAVLSSVVFLKRAMLLRTVAAAAVLQWVKRRETRGRGYRHSRFGAIQQHKSTTIPSDPTHASM